MLDYDITLPWRIHTIPQTDRGRSRRVEGWPPHWLLDYANSTNFGVISATRPLFLQIKTLPSPILTNAVSIPTRKKNPFFKHEVYTLLVAKLALTSRWENFESLFGRLCPPFSKFMLNLSSFTPWLSLHTPLLHIVSPSPNPISNHRSWNFLFHTWELYKKKSY